MRRRPLGRQRGAAGHARRRPAIEIRPAPVLRFLVAVFTLGWCGLVIASAVRLGWTPGLIIPLAMLVGGAAIGWRLLGMAAIAVGDELIVRNAYRTRRLRRSEIEGFRIGAAPWTPFGRTIHALLPDETVSLDVGLTLVALLDGRAALEERLQELRGWLAEPSRP